MNSIIVDQVIHRSGLESFLRSRQSPRVLIVEDDPYWQTLISRTLQHMGKSWKARCVRSAKHARQLLFEKQKFDLIISDHLLDGKETGLDVWRYCSQHYPRVPFLLVSAQRARKFAEELRHQGAPAFLAKPFVPNDLREVLCIQLGLRF